MPPFPFKVVGGEGSVGKIILNASDLDGYLSAADKASLSSLNADYDRAKELFQRMEETQDLSRRQEHENALISLYHEMGNRMQAIADREEKMQVYSWATPPEVHGEVSRLIAKLRDVKTGQHEFIYYIQRAYELLFNFAFAGPNDPKRNYLIVGTPIRHPVQNFAVHRIPLIDEDIQNTVMCVMLRGALLPAMIMSKEIQEYSSGGYITPFALFKISRNDEKTESDMEYILDLDRSYFELETLDGKDLIFADPMNATGGSLVTIVQYLLSQKIEPRSVLFFNVISALKGALRIIRAIEKVVIYTLWMDPVLNSKAYILPGLGDAGDRINGPDPENENRDIIQLLATYGSSITSLYRSQVSKVEETVLGRSR
jgi:uracil phosphoribosyltransferase